MVAGMGTGTTLLGGAAIFGLIGAAWSKIRYLAGLARSTVVVRVHCRGDLSIALSAYCFAMMKRSPFSDRVYNSSREYVVPVERFQEIAFEDLCVSNMIFWRGWRPLFFGHIFGEKADSQPADFTLTYIRGTFDFDKLVSDAMSMFNKRYHSGVKSGRFRIERLVGTGSVRKRRYSGDDSGVQASRPDNTADVSFNLGHRRPITWTYDELGFSSAGRYGCRSLDSLYFPENVLSLIVEARHWLESEKWYKEKKIPWRRGLLLYGPPGCGKTVLVRSVAEDFDLPLMVFDLATMSNDELIEKWKKLQNSVPCIALFEDIDGVFKGRENRLGEEGGGLTFDCLLNCLSGVEHADGVLVVVTTNKIEDLDEALGKPTGKSDKKMISTRPGRIDKAIELGLMDEKCRMFMAKRILVDCPEMIDFIVNEGVGDTPAQFQERCSQLALSEHWRKLGG